VSLQIINALDLTLFLKIMKAVARFKDLRLIKGGKMYNNVINYNPS